MQEVETDVESVFTGVVSTTTLEDASTLTDWAGCPRELLGLGCVASEYPCLCEQVASCTLENVMGQRGETVVLNLGLAPFGNAAAVIDGLDLTGLKGDFTVSMRNVSASFNLRRPENFELRERM